MRRAAAVLTLGVLIELPACHPGESPTASSATPSTVVVQVRTSLGEPLAGAEVRLGQMGVRSDELGRATLQSGSSQAQRLIAHCPAGHSGSALETLVAGSLLGSGDDLLFELQCDRDEVELAVAVLSEGCGPLAVQLDGVQIGTTSDGLLHVLLPQPERSFVELSAQPENSDCVLDEPLRTVEVDRLAPAVWALFRGKAQTPRKPKKAFRSKEARPYRL